jgi:hypothetical protein
MDEKTRLRRMGAGAGITLVITVIAGWQFGSLAVPLALAIGLGVTLLMGGGLGKKG